MGKLVAILNSISLDTDLRNLRSRKAFCPISLGNPNFYGEKLSALINFIDAHFDQVMFVTCGYLYRHNYKARGYDENAASKKSMEEEVSYLATELSLYRKFFLKDKFTITTWLDHFTQSEFQDSLKVVKSFYEANEIFRNELKDIANNFLNRTKSINSNISNLESEVKKKDFSIDFLLEEASFMNYLSMKGYTVEIYPGNMPKLFDEISKGSFSDAPDGLKKRISVQLKIKRLNRKQYEELST